MLYKIPHPVLSIFYRYTVVKSANQPARPKAPDWRHSVFPSAVTSGVSERVVVYERRASLRAVGE